MAASTIPSCPRGSSFPPEEDYMKGHIEVYRQFLDNVSFKLRKFGSDTLSPIAVYADGNFEDGAFILTPGEPETPIPTPESLDTPAFIAKYGEVDSSVQSKNSSRHGLQDTASSPPNELATEVSQAIKTEKGRKRPHQTGTDVQQEDITHPVKKTRPNPASNTSPSRSTSTSSDQANTQGATHGRKSMPLPPPYARESSFPPEEGYMKGHIEYHRQFLDQVSLRLRFAGPDKLRPSALYADGNYRNGHLIMVRDTPESQWSVFTPASWELSPNPPAPTAGVDALAVEAVEEEARSRSKSTSVQQEGTTRPLSPAQAKPVSNTVSSRGSSGTSSRASIKSTANGRKVKNGRITKKERDGQRSHKLTTRAQQASAALAISPPQTNSMENVTISRKASGSSRNIKKDDVANIRKVKDSRITKKGRDGQRSHKMTTRAQQASAALLISPPQTNSIETSTTSRKASGSSSNSKKDNVANLNKVKDSRISKAGKGAVRSRKVSARAQPDAIAPSAGPVQTKSATNVSSTRNISGSSKETKAKIAAVGAVNSHKVKGSRISKPGRGKEPTNHMATRANRARRNNDGYFLELDESGKAARCC